MRKNNIRVRLTDDLGRQVGKLIADTGWSENQTANTLIRSGLLAVTGNPKEGARGVTLEAIRKMIEATVIAGNAKPHQTGRLL